MTDAKGWFKRPDVLSGLTLLCLAVFAWASAWALPIGTLRQPGAGFFPKHLALLMALLAVLLIVRGCLTRASSSADLWSDRTGVARVGGMLATLVGYVFVVETVGYIPTTAALFLVVLRWIGRQGWGVTLTVAVLASGGSYLVFARWLAINLPSGAWTP
jgi:putative tricarboxylic transport membrane protein